MTRESRSGDDRRGHDALDEGPAGKRRARGQRHPHRVGAALPVDVTQDDRPAAGASTDPHRAGRPVAPAHHHARRRVVEAAERDVDAAGQPEPDRPDPRLQARRVGVGGRGAQLRRRELQAAVRGPAGDGAAVQQEPDPPAGLGREAHAGDAAARHRDRGAEVALHALVDREDPAVGLRLDEPADERCIGIAQERRGPGRDARRGRHRCVQRARGDGGRDDQEQEAQPHGLADQRAREPAPLRHAAGRPRRG